MFSSIQGEGILIGKRQIFIRFAGCNISCKYCDTESSKTSETGEYYTYEKLNDTIQALMTDDVDSIEITGGEPLLHSEYIKEFLSRYNYKSLLETNATLPENLQSLKNVIDIVSMDIKLPEHFDLEDEWKTVYKNEIESIRIMEENKMDYYIKIVISPTTPSETIEEIIEDLIPITNKEVEVIIQPVSPMSLWKTKSNIFKISEKIGKHFNVSIIPQMQKYMQIE